RKNPDLFNEIVRVGSDFLLERGESTIEGRFVETEEGGQELLLKLYLGLGGVNQVNHDPIVLKVNDQESPNPIFGLIGNYLLFEAQIEPTEIRNKE
ncbi:MAG: hypothetical protein ACI9R3_005291, partial [Verrucomicrobiales bacterium]